IVMNQRRRVVLVCVAGVVAGVLAHFVAPGGHAGALYFLAAGLVLRGLLRPPLGGGRALPPSFAVLLGLGPAVSLPGDPRAGLGAELISLVLRITDSSDEGWTIAVFVERIAVAAATFAAYRAVSGLFTGRESVASVLAALIAAAAAQVIVDVPLRHVLR